MFERFKKNLEQVAEGIEKKKLLEVPLSSERSLVAKRELRLDFLLNFLPFINPKSQLIFMDPLSFSIENKDAGGSIPIQELVTGKSFPEASSEKIFFGESLKFGADIEKNLVLADMEKLRDPRYFFVLLHEIGHLAAQGHFKKDKNELRAITNRRMNTNNPIKLMPEEHETILQEERDAWAKAIRIAREIKRSHDIDLFALFKDTDDFLNWIRVTGLRGYECRAVIFGDETFTRSQAIKKWKDENREVIEKIFEADPSRRDVEKYSTLFENSPAIKREVRLLMKQSLISGHRPSKKDVDEIIKNTKEILDEPATT